MTRSRGDRPDSPQPPPARPGRLTAAWPPPPGLGGGGGGTTTAWPTGPGDEPPGPADGPTRPGGDTGTQVGERPAGTRPADGGRTAPGGSAEASMGEAVGRGRRLIGTARPSGASGPSASSAAPARPGRAGRGPGASAPPDDRVYGPSLRWGLSAAALAVAVTVTVASAFAGSGTEAFILVHALTALPFLACAAALSWGALHHSPPEYRQFWRPWLVATCLSLLAAVAATIGVVAHMRAFVALDVLFMVASAPFWSMATLRMFRLLAGRLSVSIDFVDGFMALLVLGAPWVLVLAEPLAEADELLFAIPFAVITVTAPAGLYLSLVELWRVPVGLRVPHAIGLALCAAFTVSCTMQFANAVAEVPLPAAAFVALHVLVMALVMAVPLWSAGEAAEPLAARPAEDESRQAGPMPALAAAILPLLAVYVFATRDDRPWGVPAFVAVVLAVVALNAARHAALAREARRLHAGLAEASQERGRLLAAMLRALEDDRHRTATELHSQAVGSLATLGTIIQTAAVTLPPATATAVTDTIAGLQADLTDRAEDLRQLMVAMRAPAFPQPGADSVDGGGRGPRSGSSDEALAAALRAYAAELVRARPGPAVTVDVQRGLHLDWSTMTIAYRIAQEAIANAARHARATTVAVTVSSSGTGVAVEVRDDGCGFEPGAAAPGSGLGTMQLFASLGHGELSVASAPGEGTVVRALLGSRRSRPTPAGPAGPTSRRHLRVVQAPGV